MAQNLKSINREGKNLEWITEERETRVSAMTLKDTRELYIGKESKFTTKKNKKRIFEKKKKRVNSD